MRNLAKFMSSNPYFRALGASEGWVLAECVPNQLGSRAIIPKAEFAGACGAQRRQAPEQRLKLGVWIEPDVFTVLSAESRCKSLKDFTYGELQNWQLPDSIP